METRDCSPIAATLRIWSEVETRRFIYDLHHSPPELFQERRTASRMWVQFLKEAVLPITAEASTTLSELVAELSTLTRHAEPARRCQWCEAAPKVEALAAAVAAAVAAQLRPQRRKAAR